MITFMTLLEESIGAVKYDVYHASNILFDTFDVNHISLMHGELYGWGIYFSNNKKYVTQFGKYLYKCEISFSNPIDLTANKSIILSKFNKIMDNIPYNDNKRYIEDSLLHGNFTSAFRKLSSIMSIKQLKSAGFDGVIGYCEEGGKEYICWDDNQMRIQQVTLLK
jgi:hypothetical protein